MKTIHFVDVFTIEREGQRDRHNSMVANIAVALAVWAVAALVVASLHSVISGSVVALTAAKALTIVAAAFAMSSLRDEWRLDTAIVSGFVWLVASVAVELLALARGHGFHELLGSPSLPSRLRDALMLTWLIAPTLFSRRLGDVERDSDGRR